MRNDSYSLPVRLREASERLMGTTHGSKFCQLLEEAAIELERLSCGPQSSLIAAMKDRIAEGEGYVSDDAKREQKHLDAGSPERDYWHYGYLMALKDVLRQLEALSPATKERP